MTVKNISRSISMKECCRPRWGSNPRPPGLQSDPHSTEPPRLAEEIADEMKERDKKRNRNESEETEKNKNFPPLLIPATKDSRPRPSLSQFHLNAPVT